MLPSESKSTPKPTRGFVLRGGRIYFSRQTERKLFFILTLIMLVLGIIYHMGCFAR
jgi:hypothetical protein